MIARLPVLALLGAALAAGAVLAQGRTCPVDGKPAADTGAPMVQVNRKRLYFDGAKCAAAFRRQPEKYLKKVADCPVLHNPVSKVAPDTRLVVNNTLYYFCCAGCKGGFLKSTQHLKKLEDVVTREVFEATSDSPHVEHQGQHYLFATEDSKAAFEKEPAKYAVLFGK